MTFKTFNLTRRRTRSLSWSMGRMQRVVPMTLSIRNQIIAARFFTLVCARACSLDLHFPSFTYLAQRATRDATLPHIDDSCVIYGIYICI